MTDATKRALNLANGVFRDSLRAKDRKLRLTIDAAIESAASRGTLGAGFFHKQLADVFVDELRERAALAFDTFDSVLQTAGISFDKTTVESLKEELNTIITKQASELTEQLRGEITRFSGVEWLIGEVTKELPNALNGVFVKADLAHLSNDNKRAHLSADIPEHTADPKKVFVVHGRDDTARASIFAFLRAVGLEPIEWREAVKFTGKGSPYIGEILEKAFSRAQAVVVLLTPDDEVRLSPTLIKKKDAATEKEFLLQPRPNVLFEAGMSFGYAPNRTILVELGSPKPFSDVAGRHILRLTNDEVTRHDFIDRLKTAGCTVDANGAWLTTGDFDVGRTIDTADTAPSGNSGKLIEKYVDMNYPADSGFQRSLESQGYSVSWCLESKLARKIDIEGHSLALKDAPNGDQILYKLHDKPEDHVLIKKKKGA